MSSTRPISVLHVEVGGAYGGSLRALETHLAYSERNRFVHDLLFYYRTPGAERLSSLVGKLWTLYDAPLPISGSETARASGRFRAALKRSALGPALAQVRDWIGLAQGLPTTCRLVEALLANEYDVIHVNNTFTYQAPTLLAAWKVRRPVVAHVRNPVGAGAFSKSMMRLTDHVAAVNRSLQEDLSTWGVPVAVRTCYDGVELPAPEQAVSSVLRSALVPSGGILIGSVGRLDKQKGYHDLIRAARIVVDAHPGVKFAVAGEGPLRSSLEELIAQLGLGEHFRLCGFQTDVVNFLAASDLFVSSSLWEGLPLAVIEAMLMGKPVVATDVGGNSELVIPGRSGRLVPAGDPNALASGLIAALDQKDEAARLAERGREVAAAVSDPRSNAQAFDELVEAVARASGPSAREFYEHAYSTEAWRRPEERGRKGPGWRFTKMWYRALLEDVVPRFELRHKRVLSGGMRQWIPGTRSLPFGRGVHRR